MGAVDHDTGGYAAAKRDVEALLFASGEPLSLDAIAEALGVNGAGSRESVETVLAELASEFAPGGSRGFELVRLAGGWTFRTSPSCDRVVSTFFELPDDATRLSPASTEVLAIVAYLQPVSRPQIAEIRGVNSDSPVHTLLERELIAEAGRSQGGGAVLYGTTRRFEVMFGLADLSQLPPLEGFALDDAQKEELRRKLGLLALPE